MNAVYIAIEKDVERFEYYRNLWCKHNKYGVRAENMEAGIVKAIAIKKSSNDYLFFVAIVSGEIIYLPLLRILYEEIDAPILIATSRYDEDEHDEAVSLGAFYYGLFRAEYDKNVNTVIYK